MNTELNNIFYTKDKLKTKNNLEDSADELVKSLLLAKASVPYSHRRIASKYSFIKETCKFQIVQPKISHTDEILVKKYLFKTLENMSVSEMNKEIEKLKEWAISTDDKLRDDSITLLEIRIKELKFMLSYNYTKSSNEMLNGYKALDTYLTNIPKYYN